MKNGIQDLRNHMFVLLEELNDADIAKDAKRLEATLKRADAGAQVAQAIINTAKVEVDFLRVTGAKRGTGFLENMKTLPEPSK
jgi:hypothetical protein